jgi:drug/metabolite transporter (DMT)-like permease
MKKPNASLTIILAFLTIYLVWGSTYLAIRFGIETFPPFAFAGIRFFLAGIILFSVVSFKYFSQINKQVIKVAAISGIFLIAGGNGLVTLAEKTVSSGLAALWIATIPLWMMFLNWKGFEKKRPATLEFLGGGVGVLGIGLLLSATKQSLTGLSSLPSILMLTIASISWTIGSLYQRQAKLKTSPLLVSSIQMLAGGLFLIAGSTLSGEIFNLHFNVISQKSALSLLYLIFVGAIVGFSTYTYLIKNVEPAKVSTYALVNPVVAVFLGVVLAGEVINPTMLLALLLVLLGVGLILLKPFLVKMK